MNAQEINILIEYWKEKKDLQNVAYYEQKLEQYQKDQYRD